jgi:predicted metal-binding membrane protein
MPHATAQPEAEKTAPPPARAEWRVYALAATAFTAAAIPTVYFSFSMRGAMPMPGGWQMSMAWMPMGGWAGSALLFAAMWVAMMVAMMLPSTMPVLLLHRRAVLFRGGPAGSLTAMVAAGYFLTWTAFGLAAYAAGISVTQLAMHSHAVSRTIPPLSAAALIMAGAYQLSAWKQSCLRHCRDPLLLVADHSFGGWRGALRLGVHHGAFCIACCWAIMLVQLVAGVMDLRLMAAVAVVIAAEKMLPRGELLARIFGAIFVVAGVVQIGVLFLL